jgi:molybdenum cofactor guanylyltransferase
MGRDKAMLPFCRRPMVEIAVEKLRAICAKVSIVGNREDLSNFAHVVHETRDATGPAAGIEAGLKACTLPWAMFMPLDVPLVPAWLLQMWAKAVIHNDTDATSGSYLVVEERPEPAFCILRQEMLLMWTEMLDQGERRLEHLLGRARAPGRHTVSGNAARQYAPQATLLQIKHWFSNVNTPEELVETTAWAEMNL